ncbi:hypothetical protein AVEN_107932-1 [Araneus ventricosus]|uniref:Uncharacterized protein n=1 Tax=Araneus ventricosus TaxID=182803 RepID=A0A4Y2L1M0_ARAVE|nr:hypothetical protein AVEN_107932-1 [Araneus ventricosus]
MRSRRYKIFMTSASPRPKSWIRQWNLLIEKDTPDKAYNTRIMTYNFTITLSFGSLIIRSLKTLRFSRGDKKFNICTKGKMIEANPQHLLHCVDLVYEDLLKRPDLVFKVIKANDLMDLI